MTTASTHIQGRSSVSPTQHFADAGLLERVVTANDGRDDEQLIRHATLAASSHNTQPWKFHVTSDAITIEADLSRRCPVVDPDDAHLFKSLGCAAENLAQAAAAQGLATDIRFDNERNAVIIGLIPSPDIRPTALFDATTRRQCTRLPFDGSAIDTDELQLLERAGAGRGVRMIVITDPTRLATIAELVAEGDRIQLTDHAFRRELVSWIRFNASAALRHGDGLAGRCSGNPSLPTWFGKLLSPLFISARSQAHLDAANIRSSAGVAVVVARRDDKPTWVEAGRSYQRFALQATALNIRTAFINQPIEAQSLRGRFETLLGLDGEQALLAVRFGHGRLAPFSLRRPINEVIVS